MTQETRAFNTLTRLSTGQLMKIGPKEKIEAEYTWYSLIPENVALYTPRVMQVSMADKTKSGYVVDFLPGSTLSDFLVNANMSEQFWRKITEKLNTLLLELSSQASEATDDALFIQKTRDRIQDLDEPYKVHAYEIIHWLQTNEWPACPSILHGDLCFSNIIYDERADILKMIDPRGYHKVNGIQGNQLYDIAKLYHSMVGLYDFIIAKKEPSELAVKSCTLMGNWLLSYVGERWKIDNPKMVVFAMTALLFYSMLPLHAEDPARVQNMLHTAEMFYEGWQKGF